MGSVVKVLQSKDAGAERSNRVVSDQTNQSLPLCIERLTLMGFTAYDSKRCVFIDKWRIKQPQLELDCICCGS